MKNKWTIAGIILSILGLTFISFSLDISGLRIIGFGIGLALYCSGISWLYMDQHERRHHE